MRYQIIKPLDIDWKLFGKILNEIQRDTREVLNKTLQLCWEYQGFSAEYKKKFGDYPKAKDVLDYAGLSGYCYNRLKTEYYKMNKGNYTTTVNTAIDKWKSDLKDILRGDKSIANYKKDCPIDLHNKSITVIKNKNNYNINLSLLSNPYKKEMELTSGQILLAIKVGDNTQKVILDRILSGEYKASASKLVKYKNKWFINLYYSFEPTFKQLDENNIMGIDMGIVYPVYMAFNNSLNRYKIEGGEIEQFRKHIESRKNQLYKQSKYCGNGRIGHGVKTRIKPIEFAKNKVSNFRDTTNHKYSKYIIDMAVKNNSGVIQMEELKGISANDAFLKNWSYFDLQQKIKYKAAEKGIEVKLIDPRYTSQRCSKCGYIHPDNRKEQKSFKCLKCGFETNADYNAARNIATKDIEYIIKESMKSQKENGEWYCEKFLNSDIEE